MLAPLAAGLLCTGLLLLVSARFSPEWAGAGSLSKRADRHPEENERRTSFALGAFGILIGIPAALGFVPANVLSVVAALAAAMMAHRLLWPDGSSSAGPGKQWESPLPAFVVLAWSILSAAWWTGTSDLRRAVAVQAVLGPAALSQGSWRSVLLSFSFLAGVAAAVFWVRRGPSIAGPPADAASTWLKWGQSALAGAALSAAFFGPSPGALISGPLIPELRSGVAGSFLFTCTIVAGVSWSRRMVLFSVPPALQVLVAALPLLAMGAAAFRL